AELPDSAALREWCRRLPEDAVGGGWRAMVDAGGFTDIQKRLLAYFLEWGQTAAPEQLTAAAKERLYERMAAAIEARRRWKRKKLREMEEWVHASSCRRAAIVRAFGEELSDKPDACCDNCGLETDRFMADGRRPEPAPVRPWREELWHMFFGGRRRDEAAK
ncbi:RecQ family zinc-binding domain-containing protein, partial [Anoxybacillus geothermalis]|nr:RecQ family zinc-binding domain-containing protein [Anoxybacillus geothermalis]